MFCNNPDLNYLLFDILHGLMSNSIYKFLTKNEKANLKRSQVFFQ